MTPLIKADELQKIALEYSLKKGELEDRQAQFFNQLGDEIMARVLLQLKLYLESQNQLKAFEAMYDWVYAFQDKRFERRDQAPVYNDMIQRLNSHFEDMEAKDDNQIEYERILKISKFILQAKEALSQAYHNQDKTLTKSDQVKALLKESQGQLNQMCQAFLKDFNTLASREEIQREKRQIHDLLALFAIYTQIQEKESPVSDLVAWLRQKEEEGQAWLDQVANYQPNQPGPFAIQNLQAILDRAIGDGHELKVIEKDKKIMEEAICQELTAQIRDEYTKAKNHLIKALKSDCQPFEFIHFSTIHLFEELLAGLHALDLYQANDQDQTFLLSLLDTLQLKFDALKDHSKTFSERKKSHRLSLIHDLDLKFDAWTSAMKEIAYEVMEGNHGLLDKMQGQLSHQINQIRQDNRKDTFQFTQQHLLFELASFDELMVYSVEGLRDSDQPLMTDLVACFDQFNQALKGALVDNGFQMTAPEEGSRFDGKTQEILLMEASEKYDKGQVIRWRTRGYLFEGQLLKPALVVVAK